MAFTRLDTCDYTCLPGDHQETGTLQTPYVSWGPNATLSFSQWSATEVTSGFDVRLVLL